MKILIADDHPLVRDALARTVRQLDGEVRVLLAASLDETQALARSDAPCLGIVDLNMPGMRGLEGLKELRREHPTVPWIVASGQDDVGTIRAVLAAGVAGFIPKTESCDVVLHAIRLVRSGGVYVPAQMLARSFRAAAGTPGDARAGDEVDGTLTPRQIDVLTQLLRGQPNKLIARELGLTEGTVKIHVAAILRTLRARNRTEAVVRARELGLAAR